VKCHIFLVSETRVPCVVQFCTAGHPHSGGFQFTQVQIFLKTFPLCCVIAVRWDTILQAAANLLRDPQFPRISSFGFPRNPAVSLRPLCRFFHHFTGFTPLRTASFPDRAQPSLYIYASVASWQDFWRLCDPWLKCVLTSSTHCWIVSFLSDRMDCIMASFLPDRLFCPPTFWRVENPTLQCVFHLAFRSWFPY
jgi:hypothetical protein